MLETDRGLASMRTCQPAALFGENEQKSVKMSAKPVRKRERRRRRRKKTRFLVFLFSSRLRRSFARTTNKTVSDAGYGPALVAKLWRVEKMG